MTLEVANVVRLSCSFGGRNEHVHLPSYAQGLGEQVGRFIAVLAGVLTGTSKEHTLTKISP